MSARGNKKPSPPKGDKVSRAPKTVERAAKAVAQAAPVDRRPLAQAAEETSEGVEAPPTIWEMADQMERNDHMFVAAIAAVNELLGVVLRLTQSQQRDHLWDRQHAGALAHEAVSVLMNMRQGDTDTAELLRDIARAAEVHP